MNTIKLIAPYRYLGLWVFDDPSVGLVQEPFVGGADTVIDQLVKDIPDADKGFRMLFSASPFPGYHQKLDWVRPELGGNMYLAADLNLEGWLCPALLKYFELPPKEIYVKIDPIRPPAEDGP